MHSYASLRWRAEEADIERMGSRSTLHMPQFQTEVGKMFVKSNWVLGAHREGGTQGATQERYISSPIKWQKLIFASALAQLITPSKPGLVFRLISWQDVRGTTLQSSQAVASAKPCPASPFCCLVHGLLGARISKCIELVDVRALPFQPSPAEAPLVPYASVFLHGMM